MMDERTTGLVLRVYPLTESSLIVHWLTADCGRLSTVAKGARRPKSPFRGKLDLYYLADFSFRRSRRSELHLLKEIGLKQTHPGLRSEIGFLHQAAYCAALIEHATETETPLPLFFQLFLEFLDYLPRQSPQPIGVLAFELKLLDELGLRPAPSGPELSPASSRLLVLLTESSWPDLNRTLPTPAQMTELSRFSGQFWQMHDLLFGGQDEWNTESTDNPKPVFMRYAAQIGLDAALLERRPVRPRLRDFARAVVNAIRRGVRVR